MESSVKSVLMMIIVSQSVNPFILQQFSSKGPSIKYVTFEGEEVREDVTVCDRGEGGGKKHVTSHL